MRQNFWLVTAFFTVLAAGTADAQSLSQTAASGDPPARVGRLAFIDGAVSFHDNQQTDWSPAAVNMPLVAGDAIWTEPDARSELAVAGTRVRLDSASELDVLAVDDTQTRLQLDQGRIDIKTFDLDTHQPYQVVTPRGVVTLEQQGDYYVLAGSTEDPTELGVRSGAAQIQAANGQVLAVRAGEIGMISGDEASPQLQTMHQAPPPLPAYWAQRDSEINYGTPQYISADVTGYEDLSHYGTWSNDPDYGEVWMPRTVPAGWAPYRTGHWAYVAPWGWTWVDEQPWGFAPYHYGRWAQRGDRWMWVPPQRDVRPVYAPALVAFVGGVELGVALGAQSAQPVGWFPLGPREVYVPPYTRDRDYYRRLNMSARVDSRVLDDRWQRAERHEALRADERNEALANRRFATVVPAQAFTRSEPVQRVALKVDPQKLNALAVAPTAAPPSPKAELRAGAQEPPNRAPNQAQRPNPPQQQAIETLGRPSGAELQHRQAPGPKFAAHAAVPTNGLTNAPPAPAGGKAALPQLAPRNPKAPPPPHKAEAPPHQAVPGNLPPARGPQAERPNEPPRPAENHAPQPQQQPHAPAQQPPHQAETPHPQPQPQAQHPVAPPAPPHQAETPHPQPQPQAQHPVAPPAPPHQAEAPHPQPQPQAEHPVAPPAPPHQAEAPHPQPQPQAEHPVAPPAPPHQAEAPNPQPQPQAQRPATPPQQHEQAHAPAPPQQHPQQAQSPQQQHEEQKKEEKK
jgi:hypothetical protein